MSSSLRLDLPKTAGAKPTDAATFVSVAISPQGALFWGDEAVSGDQLKARIREAAECHPSTEVQLRADQAVPYGRIAELIGLVQDDGLSRIGFTAEAAVK